MGRRRTDCRNEYKWKEGVEGGRRKEERFGREGGKERERKEPYLTNTHNITDHSESPDCPPIHFNT